MMEFELDNTGANKCEVHIGGSQWLFSYRTLVAGRFGWGANRRKLAIDSTRTSNKHIYAFLCAGRKEIETVSEGDLKRHFTAYLAQMFFEEVIEKLTGIRNLCVTDSGPARVVNHLGELIEKLEEQTNA